MFPESKCTSKIILAPSLDFLWFFENLTFIFDPVTPFDLGIFFHLVTFVESQDVSCHQISWQYLVTLMSWNFFCEKRFLTLIDLRWPLTPCWSRDIIGLAHCYFGPSLMKIGHKTWEIWAIKVLKERKKKEERRKKERKKRCKTRPFAIASQMEERTRTVNSSEHSCWCTFYTLCERRIV